MQNVLNFLNQLRQNNNKQWFEDHKKEFKEAQAIFNDFTEKLIAGIATFDTSISNLTTKDCTYRIYRDIRFSNDKTPYKSHMGAFVAPKGKNGGFSGYYFHIEAKGAQYIGGHMMSTGIYCPDSKVVKSIREEIMLNGKQFEEAIKVAKDFVLDSSSSLKRIPVGFPPESEYSEYFKLKDFFLTKFIDDDFIKNPNLVENTVNDYKKTLIFNNLLNKAAIYAYEL